MLFAAEFQGIFVWSFMSHASAAQLHNQMSRRRRRQHLAECIFCWPSADKLLIERPMLASVSGLVSHGMRCCELYLGLLRNSFLSLDKKTPCNNLLKTDSADLRMKKLFLFSLSRVNPRGRAYCITHGCLFWRLATCMCSKFVTLI